MHSKSTGLVGNGKWGKIIQKKISSISKLHFIANSKSKYLDKLELIFLGFEDKLVIENFKINYSDKDDLFNLDKWEEYEKSNPRIFAGMYQFWCKK